MKLRLLLFETCNRSCDGCCNQDWDLHNLPVCPGLSGWDEVLLTGGEPMLKPDLIIGVSKQIPQNTKLYLYTAKVDVLEDIIRVLGHIDGLTVTLHEQEDVEPFQVLNKYLLKCHHVPWSLRLHVFKEVFLPEMDLRLWQVKDQIVWIKNAPLPQDEVFMKLPLTF